MYSISRHGALPPKILPRLQRLHQTHHSIHDCARLTNPSIPSLRPMSCVSIHSSISPAELCLPPNHSYAGGYAQQCPVTDANECRIPTPFQHERRFSVELQTDNDSPDPK